MATGPEINEPLFPVAGVRVAAIKAGIRYPDRLDLVLIELAPGSRVAGVFTRNAFCAAPVRVAKENLLAAETRFLLINTGNANAGTGAAGLRDAQECCQTVADAAGVSPEQVLPFSTGVIGQALPKERIKQAIPKALQALKPDDWRNAARGIMTTDTRPKAFSRQLTYQGKTVNVTGIAKGAGMIKPNMATMLSFICTDARVDATSLQELLANAVSRSFNRITVDGDTSTNDSCILVATGGSGVDLNVVDLPFASQFRDCIVEICTSLATAIIRDAEGAGKFVTVRVINGTTEQECLAVAYAIAESPLVKTALFASDPNWGRILAAVGRAGVEQLDIDRINIQLGDTPLVAGGTLAASYSETQGQAEMDKEDISITVDLQRGPACETVWTSDLSHDYVRINAEYRT